MLIDGIEIVRLKENDSCYVVDDNFLLITDNDGRIIFEFNLKHKGENVENLAKDVAQRSIFRYDVIKSIQGCN